MNPLLEDLAFAVDNYLLCSNVNNMQSKRTKLNEFEQSISLTINEKKTK